MVNEFTSLLKYIFSFHLLDDEMKLYLKYGTDVSVSCVYVNWIA